VKRALLLLALVACETKPAPSPGTASPPPAPKPAAPVAPSPTPTPAPTIPASSSGGLVTMPPVPDALRACTKAADCVTFTVGCSADLGGANRAHVDEAREAWGKACNGSTTMVMAGKRRESVDCVAGLCTARIGP
jgi:hypothetical protein